jgi:predicted lysophospholipase L1 biosynthesis ABC-type transport system permease subunit
MAEGAGDKIALDVEIVGLVRDARYSQIKEAPPPQYFLPYRQSDGFGSLNFYVRSTQPAEQLVLTIPIAVRRVDGTLPVENLRTMADQLRSTLNLDRFVTVLSVGFAGLATLLSAIGLYGVLSFTVAQRRREIGVRMALGADAGRIGGLILARVGQMTAIGAVIGIFAALALSQLARSLLFGIAGQQPLVLAGAAICTAIIALAAGAIPTRRATRVDPLVALRYE